MAKFINKKTGNTLVVTNAKAIELMRKSDRYTEAEAKEAKAPKAKA
jgi:hypothetical protein